MVICWGSFLVEEKNVMPNVPPRPPPLSTTPYVTNSRPIPLHQRHEARTNGVVRIIMNYLCSLHNCMLGIQCNNDQIMRVLAYPTLIMQLLSWIDDLKLTNFDHKPSKQTFNPNYEFNLFFLFFFINFPFA